MIRAGPLQELNLGDCIRLEPDALLHFCSSKPLSPPPASGLGQIHERTLYALQVLDLIERFAPSSWVESCSDTRGVDEVLPAIETYDD